MSSFKKMKLVSADDDNVNEKVENSDVNKYLSKVLASKSDKKDTIKKFKKIIKSLEKDIKQENQTNIKISRKLLTPPCKKRKLEEADDLPIKWEKI